MSEVYSHLEASFKKSKFLRKGKRDLSFELNSFLFLDAENDNLENEVVTSLLEINEYFDEIFIKDKIDDIVINEIRSILEGAKALGKSVKKSEISTDPSNKSNILFELEKEIANFDTDQRRVALSMIEGPQRIRGLAGSGKTIILCMKIANIHLQNPEKKLLYTFYTKSLYMLVRNTIDKFYRHFSGKEPDWKKIDILHAWGGRNIDGVYYNSCSENGFNPVSFSDAKRINPLDAFEGACSRISEKTIIPKYDHILIDEAQDLPNSFFRICYSLAKGDRGENKNIVWGYDDLQSIFNIYQRTPAELFGNYEDGTPRIDLPKFQQNLKYSKNDLVLYRCYRNPLEVLITAHALGLGVYSDYPVQMLENSDHWRDVGYTISDDQELVEGSEVTIERERKNSPLSIHKYQTKNDIIKTESFSSIHDECRWIAEKINSYIDEGVSAQDILVICLDDRNVKSYFSIISSVLSNNNIRSNNLMISTSQNPLFYVDDMVTLSTVHRAKGNEAKIVLVCGIDAIYNSRKLRSGRNKIFTAFTRTKAWLVVTGMGDHARFFFKEINQSLENCPNLIFSYPDRNKIKTIQRDMEDKNKDFSEVYKQVDVLKEKGYTAEEISRVFGK